jgi:imidazolonepropionase-like amidohydrolase
MRLAEAPDETSVGEVVGDLEISRAWLIDPASSREGPGDIVVTDGRIEAVTWLSGTDAEGVNAAGVVVAPGFIDLHSHFREPGFEDAETIATGLHAAAHGGFTTVCLMPNTEPPVDDPGVLRLIDAAAGASGSPVRALVLGTVSAGRTGDELAAIGELADAGAAGFSDDGAPVRSAPLLRSALAYAGMVGLPVVDHAEDTSLTEAAEANDGLVATVLGLRGWPASAEESPVARDIAILAEVVRDNRRIAELREATRGERGPHPALIELGELVAAEVQARTARDARALVERLRPFCIQTELDKEPIEYQVLRGSFLVERGRVAAFDAAMERFASEHVDRIDVKLVGPLPPHSFVTLTREAR